MADIVTSEPQSRLQKFLRKYPRAMLTSLAWNSRNLLREVRAHARFDPITWWPRGFVPSHLAYYPDSLPSFPNLVDLYRRWIRGNKTNINGD